MVKAVRGTSNSNERGSAESRRRRKAWLIETYRANVDALEIRVEIDGREIVYSQEWSHLYGPREACVPACRCYRCGDLLTVNTVTVDRIIPGCMGGTYRRNNIRPACSGCNSETGGALAHVDKRRRRKAA